jgi:hypothetical protein
MESMINTENIERGNIEKVETKFTDNNLLISYSSYKFFQKLSKNVFSYLLQFSSYSEYPRFMMVNKFFVANIEYFLKYKVDKDKNLLDFYRKHIFLFNEKCLKLFKMNILPYITNYYIDEGLYLLFKNESLIIKQFIYNLEEEINIDLHLVKNLNHGSSTYYQKLRQNILIFISRLIAQLINKNIITELYLNESKIGSEGAQIMSNLLKFCENIKYIDFSYSTFSEEELRLILNSVEKFMDFLSIDLSCVNISLKNLKFIKIIQNLDYKKQIIIGDNCLMKTSKITADNNKRNCKQKKKK